MLDETLQDKSKYWMVYFRGDCPQRSTSRKGCGKLFQIGWYTFEGTAHREAPAGKDVASYFKAFLQRDTKILEAFKFFGLTPKIPEKIFRQMERFVWMFYSTANI